MKASVFKAPSNSKLNCKMNQTKMNTTNTTASIKAAWRLSSALIGRANGTPFVCMIACASGKKEASTLEQTRGPLIYALLEYPFFVLYPVNPATTARYRQAFKTSRAKDDPSDAQICLELLLHHREKLTPWLPEDAQTRELSCLLQHRRTAVDLRTLLSNMLRATRSRVIIPRPSSWPARISLPRLAASSCSNGLRSRSCRKRAKKACASFTTHTIAGAWMSSLD
jgi:hypothetical protein